MELWILDRFEEGSAVLEGDEALIHVTKEALPEGARPGDCFRLNEEDGSYFFDAEATAARRERIVALKHKLCGK